jgi:hypothetical protein
MTDKPIHRFRAGVEPFPPGPFWGRFFDIGRYDTLEEMTRHPSVGNHMGGCIYPIIPRRTPRSCHPRVTDWTYIVTTSF